MDLLDMIRSIDKPHTEDLLNRLMTPWGDQISAEDVLQEYPRPQFMRNSYINLNGLWDYAITTTADPPVRSDGVILVPFSPESMLSGVEHLLQPEEYLWYFKKLPATRPPFPKARLLLHFGAVDQVAEIHVNDRYLCTHVGGYLPFTVDITDAVKRNADGTLAENRLIVRVQDLSQTSFHSRGKQTLLRGGMYYTPQSGIWQTVWMEWVPEVYLRGVTITPEEDLHALTIRVETNAPVSVEAALYDNSDTFFTKGISTAVPLPDAASPIDLCRSGSDLMPCNKVGSGAYVATMRLLLDQVRPWSPEDPYLYQMELRVGEDVVRAYYAMRHFCVKPDEQGIPRFHLNHKPYFLNGVLDQGYWPDGLMTAPADKALIFDITQMKAHGFNMMRKHIKVESARWYYHCDRLGMIVWQDMVSGGSDYSKPLTSYLPTLFPRVFGRMNDGPRKYKMFSREDAEGRTQWIHEMRGTIGHLKNVPSIATWVLFNEGWGQFDAEKMTEIARGTDATRPIDQASGWFDEGGGDYRSVHNYFRKLRVEKDKAKRAFVISEYGGYACHIDGHSSVDRIYGYHKFATVAELNEAYQKLLREDIAPLIEKGLAGVVYTQVSDVEEEVNGIYTYDRKVCKLERQEIPLT